LICITRVTLHDHICDFAFACRTHAQGPRPQTKVDLYHISITIQDPTRIFQGLLTGDEDFLHEEAVRRFIPWYGYVQTL